MENAFLLLSILKFYSELKRKKKKKGQVSMMISLLGPSLSAEAEGAVGLTKAGRGIQADTTAQWPPLVPQTKQRIINDMMCIVYLLLESIANFRGRINGVYSCV